MLCTNEELDLAVRQLTNVLQTAIEQHVPWTKKSSYIKRWWTKELSDLRAEYARASRREFHTRDTPEWVNAKNVKNETRNRYNSILCKTKNDHWCNWLEDIMERDIWTASKYILQPFTDGSTSRIPTLMKQNEQGKILEEAWTNVNKSRLLSEVFFPKHPLTLPDHPMDALPYPKPLPFTPPTLQQLECQIHHTGPYKAPGPDGVPNIVLQQVFHLIGQWLLDILTASLTLGYFPAVWRS